MPKVLNVGGGTRDIPLPPQYQGWEHILLDIDPRGQPDIVADARELTRLPPAQFDAVYCSHNLEHYYRHDGVKVLAGFRHVLKEDGLAHIMVPDTSQPSLPSSISAFPSRAVDDGQKEAAWLFLR